MRFEFATAQRIIFGGGTLKEVGPLAAAVGQRAFVVTGMDTHRAMPLLDSLAEYSIDPVLFQTTGEPTVEMAGKAVGLARQAGVALVIAMGGGSAMDVGKVVAAMLTNTGDLMEYLEIVGEGRALVRRSAPWIAIPTTAGTGAEVTSNAVLDVPEHGRKVSMRSPLMLAHSAVVDPELTYRLPPAVTASTGLDALTQLIEPFLCKMANPMTDTLCRAGIGRAGRSLLKAFQDGLNTQAREDMAIASLFSGMALSNAKLGAVHGLAGPIGGRLHAPHGAVCGRLLPFCLEINLRVLRARRPDSIVLRRFDELGKLLTGRPKAKAMDAVQWVHGLCHDLGMPPLARYGLTASDIPEIVDKALTSSSMKGNPIELGIQELTEILDRAM